MKITQRASLAFPSGEAPSMACSHQSMARAPRLGRLNENAQATRSSSIGSGSTSCGASPNDSPAAVNAAPGSGSSSPVTNARYEIGAGSATAHAGSAGRPIWIGMCSRVVGVGRDMGQA